MNGMTGLLVVASALAATANPHPQTIAPASELASLAFTAKDQMLVGTVYGIDAVDDQPRLYGQRLAADVLAGRRTVSYTCPGEVLGIDGARLTYDFAPGGRYELVCRAGKAPEIRQVDDC